MIAVNRPKKGEQLPKSKLMALTQRDVDPISGNAPVFVNERLAPKSIECFPSPNGSHQTCVFTDAYGQKSTLGNISFINQQVSKSTVNVYRHTNGTLRTRMDFQDIPQCEVFGVHPSLNLKCSDSPHPNQPKLQSPYN